MGLIVDDAVLDLKSNIVDVIRAFCRRVLPDWEHVLPSEVEVIEICGGITNALYKAAPSAATKLSPVAVRIYGEKTELIIDRDQEVRQLTWLNRYGFGAEVVCVFGNGRVERFIESTTLTPEQMAHPNFVPHIARLLRKFHSVEPPPDCPHPTPTAFTTIHSWLEIARALKFEDLEKKARFDKVDLQSIASELQLLQTLCEATHSPTVFSHNDLLSGNILVLHDPLTHEAPSLPPVPGDPLPLQFIDFEYSAYSYRGFDIGNHFNEYAGFDCDYSRYPDADAQKLFLRHYLGEGEKESVSETELDKVMAEVNLFALASHMYWSVWALIKACYSSMDFDYLNYFDLRWGEYMQRRDAFMERARQVFGI